MIIAGASAYSRDINYENFRLIANKGGAFLLADISHPSGLIAKGLLKDPLDYCDIITTTTHKTLRGPRGGVIMMGKDYENPFGYKNKNGEPLPGIAPVAIQQGKYLAKLLTTNQSSNIKKNFRYRDKGMMATIGGFKAIGVIGKIQVSGLLAWLTWSLVHLVYLIGYKSKFIVLIIYDH